MLFYLAWPSDNGHPWIIDSGEIKVIRCFFLEEMMEKPEYFVPVLENEYQSASYSDDKNPLDWCLC